MGLDSVELLMAVEDYFEIKISDQEAESIETIQDFADCVNRHVQLQEVKNRTPDYIRERLFHFFETKKGIDLHRLLSDTPIKELIKDELKTTWNELTDYLGFALPELNKYDLNPGKIRPRFNFLGLDMWLENTPVTDGSLTDLWKWILAINHEKIYHPQMLNDKSEVELIVIGITSDKIGVPVHAIRLEHRIVKDLGVD